MLCGGSSKVPNTKEVLEEITDVNVEILNPFRNISYSDLDFDTEYLNDIGPKMGVVVGVKVGGAAVGKEKEVCPWGTRATVLTTTGFKTVGVKLRADADKSVCSPFAMTMTFGCGWHPIIVAPINNKNNHFCIKFPYSSN